MSSILDRHRERFLANPGDRRAFEAPERGSPDRVLLHFGAVDWEAEVWVNGNALGTHRGGFDGFSFDITDALGRTLMFRASYTWSKSMDDQSAFLATDGNDNTPQDSRNLAAEWGLSDFDVRHRGVVSGSYMIPDMGAGAFGRVWRRSIADRKTAS